VKGCVDNVEWNDVDNLTISDKYQFRNTDEDDVDVYYVNDLDDVTEIMKTFNSVNVKVRFVTSNDLTPFLFKMIENKYTPCINTSGGNIQSLIFKLKINKVSVVCSIQSCDINIPLDNDVYINNVETYKKYLNVDNKFYNQIMNKDNISEFHEDVIVTELEYVIGPLSGYFGNVFDKSYNLMGVDMRKAYTSCLKSINKVPVFGYFDRYQVYDNHEIEDLTMYIIEHIAKDDKTIILSRETTSRMFGFKLKSLIDYKIIYFRRPSNINEVDYSKPIDELYATDLSTEHKKFIVNKTTGLLEKFVNNRSITRLFKSFSEAQFYQIKYGGKIQVISGSHFTEEEFSDEEIADGYIGKRRVCNNSDNMYLLTIERKKQLTESFKYIKEMIYNLMDLEMYKRYNLLTSKGIIPLGIHVDSIIIPISNIKKLKKFIDFKDVIGGYKLELNKKLIEKPIVQGQHILQNVNIRKVQTVNIIDEYDDNEFKQLFDNNNRTMILGALPGVGKSSAVKRFANHNTLFISPYNKLCQELKKDGFVAITLNKLLGFFGDGVDLVNTKTYDVTPFDCICFDEIALYTPNLLKRIDQFMINHSRIKFMATGDTDQLQPFGSSLNNVKDIKKYTKQCHGLMFPTVTTLSVNKRVKTEKERETLKQLKIDIFNVKLDVMATFKKHKFKIIEDMKDVKTTKNICYFNYRQNIINRHIHKQVAKPNDVNIVRVKGIDYYNGLELICSKHYSNKGVRLFVNYTYKIIDIDDKSFTVCDILDDTPIKLDINKLEYFKLPYSSTCHAVQGMSIDDKITIFDTNTPYSDRSWIWTSITRATKLSNIQIFKHNDNEVTSLDKSKMKQHFVHRIAAHKSEDIKKNRTFKDDDFITMESFAVLYNALPIKACKCCNTAFEKVVIDGKVISNISIDRLDNSKAHITSNCQIICSKCNIEKSNHY
jgi:5-methylcytosine-specific restriction endonuclease McrA